MKNGKGRFCNFLKNYYKFTKNILKSQIDEKEIKYSHNLSRFERLTFLVLIGYVILSTLSVFIFNLFDSKIRGIQWPLFSISLLCLIICGIYLVFKKRNNKMMKLFYFILNLFMDAFSLIFAYISINNSDNNIILDNKHVFFFIISTFVIAILKFYFSLITILIYLGYKCVIFAILINVFSRNNPKNEINFTFETISFILTCFTLFLFTLIKQDFIKKSIKLYVSKKFGIEYFQSLINKMNKGFLSLNFTKYKVNVNNSFVNLIRAMGISEELIQENLFKKADKKDEKYKLLNTRTFKQSRFSTLHDLKNINSSDRFYLKNSGSLKKTKLNINKDFNIEEKKDLSGYNMKDNSELKNFNLSYIKNELPKNLNEDKNIFHNNSFNLNNSSITTQEESFLTKIDFFLNFVFCHFYEENINYGNSKNNKYHSNEKEPLSETLRDIFYSKEKIDNSDQNFIFKGIYVLKDNKKTKEKNQQNKLILEVHFRKIKTIKGDLVEFFFNDLTKKRNEEIEKAENKVKSMVFAKVSNEFKTPLITIIYILKNYIKKTYLSKNGLSFEEISTFDEDYISNTIDLSDYMLSFVNDIMDYSIIESNNEFKCEYDNFDLHELLLFSHRILKIMINCRGLKDHVHPLIEINDNVPKNFCSDEKRIKQILLNLITNSIKFTRRGYIKISAILNNEKKLIISIEDTGIGIQSKDISKIFKNDLKSFRGNNNEDEGNKIGHGLGLSICKKIIEKIGKCIEVESIPNKKTRFYFVLESKRSMKKSYSITRTIEGSLEQFKKSIMNVTTKSVKQAKINNYHPRRPNSFNTLVQMNRIHNSQTANNGNYQKRKISKELNENLKEEKVIGKSYEKNILQISNDNISNVDNIRQAAEEYNLNINLNLEFDATKSEISSSDDTIRFSETQQKMEFPYNVLSHRSNSSNHSIRLKSHLLQKPPRSNIKSSTKVKSEIDKSFMKIIKPIKKFYDMKNKDIILIVDDNKFLRKSLKNNIKSIFTNTCVDVIGCNDGIESLYLIMLDQMTKNSIRLIISDENMVYMNGTDLNMILSSFYTEGKMPFIPFALCSAARDDDEFMIRNRINYIIKKPPTKNELKSIFMTLNLI